MWCLVLKALLKCFFNINTFVNLSRSPFAFGDFVPFISILDNIICNSLDILVLADCLTS